MRSSLVLLWRRFPQSAGPTCRLWSMNRQISVTSGWREHHRENPCYYVSNECKRSLSEPFLRRRNYSTSTAREEKAYIALGSNLGDRIGNIERACRELDNGGIRVTRTSSLYETAPMYVEDQGAFINGVCEVEAGQLSPIELLSEVKAIENKLGRRKTIDKGPRNIDLDILLQGGRTVSIPDLTVPHALMHEREFVLRPLSDLIPHVVPPKSSATISQQLTYLSSDPSLSTLTPLTLYPNPSISPLTPLLPARRTHVMAILNLTPDSFSDGSQHSSDPKYLLPLLRQLKASGATMLDIGGQSTAPKAPEVSASEELNRVIPAITLLRSHAEFSDLAISIDTYRAAVADEAVRAGADIVNDISGGTMDPDMLPTVARLGCSYVLMHMRGTPETMTSYTSYPDGLVPTVASELRERLNAAEKAGIRRWRMILDPGIGFAKNQEQNLELLRRLGELREWEGLRGLPWVVGASRKRFVGRVTGVKEPRERVWGTAAAVSASIAGGADIVRVHDVEEMKKVVMMGDAIWRVDESRGGQ